MSADPLATATFPQLGRYQVLRKLGEGGMGAVYLALDAQLDRQVAIKVLPDRSVNNADSVGRFQREARALAKLSHPGIIQAFDNGSHNEHHFLVMEFVDGKSLADLVAEKGTLAPTRVADYGHQAALALQHAHTKGLIHRDLKPSNLLVTSDGQVKILDLGLARFLQDQIGDPSKTREGVGMGTPDYAAPEQFRDAHAADVRADIYALGCTLYHLLTGRVPFPGTSLAEKYDAHATKEPPPIEERCADAPAGLALVVRKMMAKKPVDRFQTAQEVADALAPFIATSSKSFQAFKATATWHAGQLKTTALQPPRRRLGLWALAGCVALVLFAVGAWMGPRFLGPSPGVVAANGDKPDDKDKGQPAEEPKKNEWLDPNVLTVSKEEKDGGEYRTITEALRKVTAGQTIRVLDDAVYAEHLQIFRREHAGLRLEAPRHAVLEWAKGASVRVDAVRGVTMCGFRFRAAPLSADPNAPGAFVFAHGDCSGLVVERSTMETPRIGRFNAIEIWEIDSRSPAETAPPIVIRDNVIRTAQYGILLSGCLFNNYHTPTPVEGVVIRDNLVEDCRTGICAMGTVRRAQIVGNRVTGATIVGLQLENLLEGTEDVLLANNTIVDCRYGVRGFDTTTRGKNVQVRNNLVLSSRQYDFIVVDNGGRNESDRGPGNGAGVAAVWRLDHNWRQGPTRDGSKGYDPGWIPPTEQDVLREEIKGIERDAKSPHFLRPETDSDLTTKGAGNEEPSLPHYVGAVPPEGAEPWDWDRTWLAWPGTTKLLTVTKDEKDGGTYRSINAALDKAKPWDTIRVLDDATYEEVIALTDKDKHEGVCLEAVRGATLQMPENGQRLLFIRTVPHVQVTGFDLTGKGRLGITAPLVSISGDASGVKLSHLNLSPGLFAQAVLIQDVLAEPPARPLRLRNCRVTAADPQSEGVVIAGTPGGKGTCGVQVADCRINGVFRGVVVKGLARDVQVVGNRIWQCSAVGLQTETLQPASTRVLLTANSVIGCRSAYRNFEDEPFPEHTAGQVEISNNLFAEAGASDILFVQILKAKGGQGKEVFQLGDAVLLQTMWHFRRNYRDFSGSDPEGKMPLAKEDRLLDAANLETTAADAPDRWRPKKNSALARDGAGVMDPSLPAYVGALPPEGVAPWDWDRTWRARLPKRLQTNEAKEKDKSDK